MSEEGATFKQETVQKLLQLNFQDDKTKVNNEALKLTTELLRVFITEGAARAAKRAKVESSAEVSLEHFEKILPQLMLDF